MKFGDKLRGLRAQKDMSQEEVAKAIGITRENYTAYERQNRHPRHREMYWKLAEVLDCEVNYLLTEDAEFVCQASDEYGSKGKAQAEKLVSDLTGLFAGGMLSEEDRDAVMLALQKAYFDCKKINKKYTPKKNRKDD